MLLVDKQIRERSQWRYADYPPKERKLPPMIDPFSEAVSGDGVISFGLTSAGYDLRLGGEVFIFKSSYGETVDPASFKDEEYRKRVFDKVNIPAPTTPTPRKQRTIIIPAHSYILGHSYEYLRIPRDLKARCVGKSTLARCGVLINTTPLEPGWEGHLTIEIANISPCPVRVYAYEGIAQLEFETLAGEVETDYGDKGGKYQGQQGVTPARVKE